MGCAGPAVVSNIPVVIETTWYNPLVSDQKKLSEWGETSNALDKHASHENKGVDLLNAIRRYKVLLHGNSMKLTLEVRFII